MTIKTKILFWFLLPSILIATIATTFCYFYIRKAVEQNVLNQLEIAADELREHVHHFLEEKRSRTVDFSSDGFIMDFIEEITMKEDKKAYPASALNTHLITNKKSLDPSILEVFVVDFSGKVISSTEDRLVDSDVSGEVYFSKTLGNGSSIGDIHYSPEFGQNTLESAQLLFSKEEQTPIGIIVNRYKGDSLKKITHSGIAGELGQVKLMKGLGETGELYIVNKDKLMITGSRFKKDAILKQIVDTEGVRTAFDNGEGMIGVYEDYRGISILGVSRYIEEMDWVVLAEKDVSEAFAPIVHLRNFAIVMGIMGIMPLVIVAVFLAGGITKPIEKLIKATKRIASGDLEHTVEIGKGNNEINELSASFNLMTRKLRESDKQNKELFLQVKRGRDEWQTTFDAITDIITIHDKDLNIIRANKAFIEKFNIDIKEKKPFGKKCYEVFYGTDNPWHNCPLQRSITNMQVEHEEINNPKMGGTFLFSTYPLKSEEGKYYGFVHVVKDITARKNLEEKLLAKATDVEKLNVELEDFIYIVSHDLKEPLFSIGGYVSRLSNLYNNTFDDKGKLYLHRAKVNIKIMSVKIDEIMKVIKAGRVKYNFRQIGSSAIVKDVVNGLEGKIKESKIEFLIQDNLPTVSYDARSLREVFFNLITNAIKFMDVVDKRQIKIGCHKNEHYYKFFVEDNGIGIQAKYQEQIFKMFKRLRDIKVEGTGAGLALVKKLVEKHTGEIWVESPVSDGRGSVFWFTVPMINNQVTQPQTHKESSTEIICLPG